MKKKLTPFALLFISVFLLGSCVGNFFVKDEITSLPSETTPAARAAPAAASSFTDGLEKPGFRALPEEAAEYLSLLSKAFIAKNKNFIFSQGEEQYEKDNRGKYDDDVYLAMLYRAGAYSEDSERTSAAVPVLDLNHIRGIEYLSYTERGPLLEVKGRFHLENGQSVPCTILLVWRLVEPKIQGIYHSP